jgi:GDP-L-fucose synthase
VDDMAAASIFVMQLDTATYKSQTEPMQSHINVGFGSDVTIAELAKVVGSAVGYQGKISFDATKPDGSPRKWMDSGRLNQLGWSPKVILSEGIKDAYAQFMTTYDHPIK